MVVFVRHGEAQDNDPQHKKVGGWSPAPLNHEGIQQAHQAGQLLAGLHPDSFHTSDIPRAHQTAQIVGKYIGHAPVSTSALRTWNSGSLAGKKYADAQDQVKYYLDHPNIPVPGGESIDAYLERFLGFIKPLVQDDKQHLIVGHSRGAGSLQGVASPVGGVGQQVDRAFMQNKPEIHPGGMLVIHPSWALQIHNLPKISGASKSRQGIMDRMS